MTFRIFSIIYLLAATIVMASFALSWPDGRLHIIACDVGQGDSYLVTKGFSQIVYDSGKNVRVLDCLNKHMPFWDKRIDLIVASHDDHDHVGGITDIIDSHQVAKIFWNGKASQSEDWAKIETISKQAGIELEAAQGKKVQLNGVILDVIWPLTLPSETDEDNSSSVVVKMSYGSFSVLFSGDIGTLTEEKLIKSPQTLASTVLKVSHHGSKTATSDDWLSKISPKVALIGVGKNSYGHPHPDVLQRLESKGIQTFRTDKDGMVELVGDGKNWWVSK